MSQRLGLASALLGDPPVIICDEPVNGLDPEGIRWIRTLLRGLAAEGRTVFVSSHLMSEMALTADHVIVVGRGRLLADTSIQELLRTNARTTTLVRSPDAVALRGVLTEHGGSIRPDEDDAGAFVVSDVSTSDIGELAAQHGFTLHELTPRQPSLESAFLELTSESVDFRANRS
jgi:ABC-2 type transport system ATP-binding protein